jgi:sialic acid synthase SpsE
MHEGTQDIWQRLTEGKVFFIAEIGKNFIQTKEEQSRENYLQNAKELVGQAKESGADAVKFQTHFYRDEQWPVNVVSPHFDGSDRYTWVKRNSLITNENWWWEIKQYCDNIGVVFFSTPMSRGAAKLLNKVGVPLWKVGSGDILDFVMLDYLRQLPQPIIISTGMSSTKEVDRAVRFITERNKRLAILHCVSKYPCPIEELNVRTVRFLRTRYWQQVGFSDHSRGFTGVLQAVKHGATIIEKHFTANRAWWGSDHKVSMLPDEYREMVKVVRRGVADIADDKIILGSETKRLADSRSEFRGLFRKSLVCARDIKKGEIIKPSALLAMRPQDFLKGLGSEHYEAIVNKIAWRDMKAGEIFTEQDGQRINNAARFRKRVPVRNRT